MTRELRRAAAKGGIQRPSETDRTLRAPQGKIGSRKGAKTRSPSMPRGAPSRCRRPLPRLRNCPPGSPATLCAFASFAPSRETLYFETRGDAKTRRLRRAQFLLRASASRREILLVRAKARRARRLRRRSMS
jgi:hypothetical protein